MKSININEIKDLGKINLIDVRETNEFAQSRIEGARNIPMMGLMTNHEQFLDKNDTYYIMCLSGGRSYQVASHLESLGYDVVNLEGGISSYKF